MANKKYLTKEEIDAICAYFNQHRCTTTQIAEVFNISHESAARVLDIAIERLKRNYKPNYTKAEIEGERDETSNYNPEDDVDWSNYKSPNSRPLWKD